MKTRLAAATAVLLSFLLAACARAQAGKWDTVSYEEWGFSVQVPAGSARQDLPVLSDSWMCELYSANGLACFIKLTATPDSQLASTVIEQSIQAEIKAASKLGAARRWEQDSKQGDLYKGFIGPIKLDGSDLLQSGITKVIAGDSGVECVSMAAVGDDMAPILRIGVVGPANRQTEVVAMAKSMAALVRRNQAPKEPVAEPGPPSGTKPWPTLKKGEIELEGTVESISADGRSVSLTVDFIKLAGQNRIALSPPRSKQVSLKSKADWLTAGQRVILIGKNTGVGKPMTADVMASATQ